MVVSQIAISNPNCDVLYTLSRAGLVDLIGKNWYFVRVHDAVQVCLQHVQRLNETSNNSAEPLINEEPSVLKRLLRNRLDGLFYKDLESGQTQPPNLEPLLLKKS